MITLIEWIAGGGKVLVTDNSDGPDTRGPDVREVQVKSVAYDDTIELEDGRVFSGDGVSTECTCLDLPAGASCWTCLMTGGIGERLIAASPEVQTAIESDMQSGSV